MLRAEIRLRRRLLVSAVVLALFSLIATVRASPVFVAAPTPRTAEAAACRTIVARLPVTVDRRSRRTVTPLSGLTAAWGRPTITLTCGVPADPHPVSTRELCLGSPESTCAGAVQWFEDPFDARLYKTRVAPHLAVVIPSADGLADVLDPISVAVLER